MRATGRRQKKKQALRAGWFLHALLAKRRQVGLSAREALHRKPLGFSRSKSGVSPTYGRTGHGCRTAGNGPTAGAPRGQSE